ncbi:MAG: TraR/DksA family transcriptional regulator [Gammaproteobacteria bacterium]|nr:TraR/DksA family transcriptional regulator [Gammaproteobacteria bacterium]
MESTLTDQEIAELRQELRERAQTLKSQVQKELLANGTEQYIELAGRVHDSGDESVADLLTEVNLAILDRHVREMWDIDAAVKRMTDGVYGNCIDCNNPVPYGRLQAYPTAKRCIACQTRYERRYAQPKRPGL